MITVTGGDRVASRLKQLKMELRFAQIGAVNEVAEGCRDILRADAEKTFEGGVTPYVANGILFRSAQVQPGGVKAMVYLSTRRGPRGQLSVAQILEPQIVGGGRERKNSERAGGVRPNYLVPSRYVQRDNYGNVPGPTVRSILSAAGLFTGSAGRINQTARSRARKGTRIQRGVYVVPGVGIFQHAIGGRGGRGSARRSGIGYPLFFFTARPQYRAGNFDYYWVARTYLTRALPQALRRYVRFR